MEQGDKIKDTGQMILAKSNSLINLLEARNHLPRVILPVPAPPPCQVEVQQQQTTKMKTRRTVSFNVPTTDAEKTDATGYGILHGTNRRE